MKFLSIIVSLIIEVVVIAKDSGYKKLTAKENQARQANCGNQFLEQPSENENGVEFGYTNGSAGWLLTVQPPKSSPVKRHFTGFPISKRHLLTTSQVVLTDVNTWLVGGGEGAVHCMHGNQSTDVPQEVLKELLIFNGNDSIGVPVKGRVMYSCDSDFQDMFSPLLLELETNSFQSFKIPCLADETTTINDGNTSHSYGLDDDNIMKHHSLTIQNEKIKDVPRWIYTTRYTSENDRGGPLVISDSEKATVIGLKASTPSKGGGGAGTYFYSLRIFQNEICELIGVCGEKKKPVDPVTPPNTSTPEKPNPQPGSTSSTPTHSSATSSKPPTPSTKDSSKQMTGKPKKTPKPKVEKPPREDLYKKDINNDFFVDADFLNGAHFLNSFSLIFLVVLIFG